MSVTMLDVGSIVLGAFFAIAGGRKLFTDWAWARASYLKHSPPWVYDASGVIEVGGGIGLMVPITRFGAALVLVAMILAIALRSRTTKPGAIATAVAFPVILLAVAWLSR